MTLTSTLRQQNWRSSLQHADIRMASLEREGNKHQPNQGLKFWSVTANNIAKDRVPFVTTFLPSNVVVKKIISRNFRILSEDSRTSKIFNKPPLKAFRRAKNLKDLLVRNSLPQNPPHQSPGTFPCNRTVCRTCPRVNSSSTITTPKGHVYITGHYSCITEHIVYCLSRTKCTSIVYIEDTGRRLADHFREHRRDIINRRNNLPVPAYFNRPNHTYTHT